MSSADQAREPAWAGLEPVATQVRQVGDAWAKRIQISLGHPGRLLTRAETKTRPAPYYHFLPHDGTRPLFLKVVNTAALETQLAGNRIANWLAAQALPVSPILESYPRRLHADYQLLAYRRIDSRFATASENDLRAIGQLLASVHNGLRALPWGDDIRQASRERDHLFLRLQQQVKKQLLPEVAERQVETRLPDTDAQVIHADLNIGNLLFGRLSHQATLLDFEDATHNFHSPQVDLAMALERFVMVRTSDDSLALQLGQAFLQGYRERIRRLPTLSAQPASILQTLATRSQLLLANSPTSTSVAGEQQKFVYLHDLAAHKATLLDRLWVTLAG